MCTWEHQCLKMRTQGPFVLWNSLVVSVFQRTVGYTGAAGAWFGLLELEGVCSRSSTVLWVRSCSSACILQNYVCMLKPARLPLSTEMANVFASSGRLHACSMYFFFFMETYGYLLMQLNSVWMGLYWLQDRWGDFSFKSSMLMET